MALEQPATLYYYPGGFITQVNICHDSALLGLRVLQFTWVLSIGIPDMIYHPYLASEWC